MIQPLPLKQGDTIAIVSPARKADRDLIEKAITVITNWGLNVITGHHLFAEEHSYLSASDEKRASDLQQMLNDSTVRAIICARGGYGTTRILDSLDFSNFKKNPKWVTGFSDITSLHLAIQQQGVCSIHGIVPVQFSRNGATPSIESLKHTLFGNAPDLKSDYDPQNNPGSGTGRLIGGNLSLVVDSLGTGSEIKTDDSILVLEDVGEHFYKLDRMLVQLKRAGKFNHVKGLIVGYFSDITESTLPFNETVQQIILNHTRSFNFPVAFNFPIGHEEPNLAWVYGATAALNVTEHGSTLDYKKDETKP